jgi:glycerol-3-phosphate dehydrogenase
MLSLLVCSILYVLGGGATGAGIALECSQRGLRSLVIESEDFAAGASSKSTKLVHGGVRYLQQVFELSTEGGRLEKMKLVIEALKERSTFLTISQMHTQEIPILIPCSTIFHALFYYTGSMMYHAIYKLCADLNTFQFSIPRIITKDEINLHFKDLQCKYGVLYSDGQFNDARMVQELLLTSTLEKYHARQCSRIIHC